MEDKKKPATVRDVPAQVFIEALAEHMKKGGKVTLPKWVDIVKTGIHKELPPSNPDWFYIRMAAIARAIYYRPAGVGGMRKKFGGKKRNGVTPAHTVKGSEAVARVAFQQLEALKLVKKSPDGGRKLTKTGIQTLDRIAAQVAPTF